MAFRLEFVTELPDPVAFEAMMVEYFQVMINKLVHAGGPANSAVEFAADTMAHLDDLKPPGGRLLLATREDGMLMGCGVIRKIRPDAAELKHMYVRPEMQGLGLGRKLFEMRIAEAGNMGCKMLYAVTITGNTAMLSMYEEFGFRYIPRYPENANSPELDPYLVYLEHRIS